MLKKQTNLIIPICVVWRNLQRMSIMNIKRHIKKLLIAPVIILSLNISSSFAGLINADILWIIDVSSSMGGDISQIRTRIGQFETEMNNNGINASYGLIEFGGNVSGTDDWNIVTDMTNTFTTFTSGLNSIAANHGNPESGTSAGLYGLNNITWTLGSVKNIILVTDEDDDSDGYNLTTGACSTRTNCNAFHNELTAQNALFNVIRSPNAGNTSLTYDYLAGEHGGTAFDILSFRSDPTNFFNNFIDTKVQEVIDHGTSVPEPSSLVLFSLALILFRFKLTN